MERNCAAPDCFAAVLNKRSDALYCSDACRERAWYQRGGGAKRNERERAERQQKREAHAHPHRETDQYVQMRQAWPEYVGFHWSVPLDVEDLQNALEYWDDESVEIEKEDVLTHDPYALGWS